jgi:hypothetical protein
VSGQSTHAEWRPKASDTPLWLAALPAPKIGRIHPERCRDGAQLRDVRHGTVLDLPKPRERDARQMRELCVIEGVLGAAPTDRL